MHNSKRFSPLKVKSTSPQKGLYSKEVRGAVGNRAQVGLDGLQIRSIQAQAVHLPSKRPLEGLRELLAASRHFGALHLDRQEVLLRGLQLALLQNRGALHEPQGP